jgi:hypothetical protein
MISQQPSNKQDPETNPQAISKQLHPNAAQLIKEHATNFAESLIVYSKTVAYQKGDELVLTSHVKDALEIIQRESKRKRWKELAIFASSAILGFSIQGFLTELSRLNQSPPVGSSIVALIYASLTVISAVVATIAIMR